VILLTL